LAAAGQGRKNFQNFPYVCKKPVTLTADQDKDEGETATEGRPNMLQRYKSEKTRELAETIYKLRRQGESYNSIARQLNMTYSNVLNIYRRECGFREMAFEMPFVEYVSPRIKNALKKKLSLELLADPSRLSQPDVLRVLYLFPGVGEKALRDLADGLADAGYDTFDIEEVQASVYRKKKRPAPADPDA
jgi:trehalose/maltose hydrolase-like predicted phosphorylase